MKKIGILLLLAIIMVTGCGRVKNTPTDSVEAFLQKYQSMDSEVLAQLDKVVSNDKTMNDEQRKDYQTLMEKQYQNMSYKIKNEKISGDTATVLVEIEVFDYANSITKSKDYYNEHRDEFETKDSDKTKTNEKDSNNDDNDKDNSIGEIVDEIIDSAFIDYKIKQLKDVTDKAKYEIEFHLNNVDGEWEVEDISDADRQKIHGLYSE